MEDVKNTVAIDEVEGTEVTVEETGKSGGSFLGTALKLGLVVGGAALVRRFYKNSKKAKAKREQKAIAELEAAGYTVAKPFEQIEDAEYVEDDVQ